MHPWDPDPERQTTGGVPPKPSWAPPPAAGSTAVAPAGPPASAWVSPPPPVAPPGAQGAPAGGPGVPPPAGWPAASPSASAPGATGARDSFVAGAIGAGAALVSAFLASGVLAAVVANATGGSSSVRFPVARAGAWLFGLAFGAPLAVSSGGSASSYGSVAVGVDVHIPVPLILLVACVVTAALTVRSQHARPVLEPARVLAAAACAAVVPALVGLVTALASATSAGSSGAQIFTGNAQAGISALPAAAYPALILFAVSALARFGAGGVRVPPGLVQAGFGPSVRAAGDYLVLTAVLASVVGLAIALATDPPSVGGVLGGWLVLLPGLGVLGAQLAAFAPAEMSGSGAGSLGGVGSLLSSAGLSGGSGSASGSQSLTVFGGDAPGWTWALLLIPVLGIVVAGVRYTLRRPASTTPPLGAALLTGLLLTAVVFVLDLYLRLTASVTGQASTSFLGGASGSGAGGISIGALGYLSALVVGALIPLVGWMLTPGLYRSAPGLLRATASLPVRSRPILAVLPARSGRQASGAPAVGGHGRTGALVLGLVLLLIAAGTGVAAGRSLVDDSAATTSSVASTDVPQPDYVPPTEAAPSYAPDPATETPSYTPDPTPTAAPTVSAGGIDLAAVATDPAVGGVADTLDSYFGAINRHDGLAAVSNFDPSGAMNANDPKQVATFQHDTSTSSDDEIVIHGIGPDPANPSGYLVSVSFRSQQAPSFGPGGNEACTMWNLSYHMTPQFKLLRSSGATHSAC
jgi:hypothetical protein